MKKKYLYILLPLMIFSLLFSFSALCNRCTANFPYTITITPASSSTSSTVSETTLQKTEETNPAATDLNESTTKSTEAEVPASSDSVVESTESTQEENVIKPSGAPQISLEGGTGYLFQSASIVSGSAERDIWWNAIFVVPGSSMVSLGILDSPSDVAQISISALKRDQIEPVPGEVYAVEVLSANKYAIVRVLSIDSGPKITFEYIYPFEGELLP